ncbi:hypothetical protein [Wolbachia endosymbiont of Trichogramma kaykai]|uniref:hypothetical protein n=1 Tax=Wolbachia endosymbiont of Trichogramma kaykai TaxID=444066 RepID=UPI003892B5C0
MTLDDFLKMLEEINDTSGLSKNNIVERIKIKLERIDLRRRKDSGFNINYIFTTHSDLDPVETTLLHFASDHESIRDILIESGAYVSKQNNNRYAPLHFAIEWGCKDVISSLSGNASPRTEMAVGRVGQITLAGRLELF